MDTVYRSGSGPGEYKSPDLLFETPAGGTLLVDLGNARLSFYDAALKYKESMPIAKGEPGRGMMMVMPQAVDAQGRIYTQAIMRDPGSKTDSAPIRFDRMKGPATPSPSSMGEVEVPSSRPQQPPMSMRPVPFRDEWAGADGRVAIARAANYARVAGGQAGGEGPTRSSRWPSRRRIRRSTSRTERTACRSWCRATTAG
jgi:hypothetical protein